MIHFRNSGTPNLRRILSPGFCQTAAVEFAFVSSSSNSSTASSSTMSSYSRLPFTGRELIKALTCGGDFGVQISCWRLIR